MSSDRKNNDKAPSAGLLASGCALLAVGSGLLAITDMKWIPVVMLIVSAAILGMYLGLQVKNRKSSL